MSKISAPYLMRKRSIFYLQKRVPKQLIGRYSTQLIRKSLSTTDRKEAVRVASSLVAAMEKEWNEQILAVPDNDPVFSLFQKQTLSVPLLSEAGRFYVEMRGIWLGGVSGVLSFCTQGAPSAPIDKLKYLNTVLIVIEVIDDWCF